MDEVIRLSSLEILEVIPHRSPCFGLDCAWYFPRVPSTWYATREITDEDCAGHFGILPGVKLIDWCAQLALLAARKTGVLSDYGLLNTVSVTFPSVPLKQADSILMVVELFVSQETRKRPTGVVQGTVRFRGAGIMTMTADCTGVLQSEFEELKEERVRDRLLRRIAQ